MKTSGRYGVVEGGRFLEKACCSHELCSEEIIICIHSTEFSYLLRLTCHLGSLCVFSILSFLALVRDSGFFEFSCGE